MSSSSDLFGRMISFATWRKFVEASAGSDAMKRRVVDRVRKHVDPGRDLIDCFVVGWMLGRLSRGLSPAELRDFEATIVLTRNLDNVPIVQIDGQPVS